MALLPHGLKRYSIEGVEVDYAMTLLATSPGSAWGKFVRLGGCGTLKPSRRDYKITEIPPTIPAMGAKSLHTHN